MVVAGIIGLAIFAVIWRWRTSRGALMLALLELAVAEWSFSYAFEIASTTAPLKIFWSQIQYLGVTTAPLFYFLFAVSYSQNQWFSSTRRNLALVSIIPALTIIIAFVRPGWIWTDVEINLETNFAVFQRGFWFWIFLAYVYVLLTSGFASLFMSIFQFPQYYKSQIGTLVIGSALPMAANVVYVFNLNPLPGFDWTPVAFMFSGALMAWGIVRYRIFDLVPIARNHLVDIMKDGLMVIDARRKIVDVNPPMQTFFNRPAREIIGQQAADVCVGDFRPLLDMLISESITEGEFMSGLGERPRNFDISLSPLKNRQGEITGQLVILRDVTVRRQLEMEREALIDELQNALRDIKTLRGLLPICAHCKKIRDDDGYWYQVEEFIHEHSDADFSHGICPDCAKTMYPEYFPDK
jgi:PAS domain S-box-containing protein